MNRQIIFKYGKHVLAAAIFVLIASIYMAPSVFQGKHLSQGDDIMARGMGESQMQQYKDSAAPGEFSVWSDAMFGGMPYVAGYGDPAPALPSYSILDKAVKGIGYKDAGMILMGLICFYILMCVMGVGWLLALAGAIAFALASYNIIIIAAGHVTKAYVIALMPLALAGIKLLFDKKYLWGSVALLLGVALSISNTHIQITYYLMLLCAFIYLGFVLLCLRSKEYKHLATVLALTAGCVLFAVLPNAQKMYSQWDLGKNSIRGATELTTTTPAGEKISSGLDKDYAFQWSYGKGEMITFLIPNAYGGSSTSAVAKNSNFAKVMKSNGMRVSKDLNLPYYWGDKPFTSGPVYVGAIICFLFILGMFVISSRMKWWLLAGAFFLTLLAWGRNFDAFNTFMFHYLPLYNKFRTVEMALVIPGMVLPIIGIWGLNDILKGKADAKLVKRGLIWSVSICGGLCLLVWLFPGLLACTSAYDSQMGLPAPYLKALVQDRHDLASSDAFRSLVFVLASAALVLWFIRGKKTAKEATIISAAFAVLMIVDFWPIDRRYLNETQFVKQSSAQTYSKSAADKVILADQDLSYRVMTLNNPFQETKVSFYHHSIGGYHAAKLRRYQELIDHRLNKELGQITGALSSAKTAEDVYGALAACPSLNMLNTRYFIYSPDQNPIYNPFTFGNAWFVKDYTIVENADAEMSSLNTLDPRESAVVDKRFAKYLEGFTPSFDTAATIELTAYRPNRLTYRTSCATDQLAVFSEIYYNPGWNVTIDGAKADHFRADWTLRSMIVPAGDHTIEFEFRPAQFVTAAYISRISSFLILLMLIACVAYSVIKARKKS